MTFLADVIAAFQGLAWMDYVAILIGIVIGYIAGILPGLGASQAMALLIPLTYGTNPLRAIIMLMTVAGAAPSGGSVTSILLNTPGEATNVATCWDGYPLARQGRAGLALGAAGTASLMGALVGILVLMVFLPIGRAIVLTFSYPELFAMALAGLISIILVDVKNLWKGFISLALGMVIAAIGYDPVTGSLRYTFGTMYLWNGIKMVPALVGIFAISEGIKLVVEDRGETKAGEKTQFRATYYDVFAGAKAVFRNFWLTLQSAVIGVIIGIIPGIGGSVSNLLAYGAASQMCRENPQFGKGDIRGVIAAEAGSNSKGGELVPTVIFGIPGSVTCAVLLSALMLHGIQPGPRLILEKPMIVYGLIIAILFGSMVASFITVFAAPYFSSVPNIPDSILGLSIIVLGVLGGYATELNFHDAIVAIIFGFLGYFMSEFRYSKVAVVMTLVLGKILQVNFFLTMDTMGLTGFLRPIPLVIFVLCALMIVKTLMRKNYKKEDEP